MRFAFTTVAMLNLFASSFAWLPHQVTIAAEQPREAPDAAYHRDCSAIRELARLGDFAELKRSATSIYDQWNKPGTDQKLRALVLVELTEALGSVVQGKPAELYELARRLAAESLAKADSLPIQCEIRIIDAVPWDPSALAGTNTRAAIALAFARGPRSNVARYYFHALKRIDLETDPEWSEEFDTTRLSPLPDGIQSGANGMAPDTISDPKLRAAYLRVLAKNGAIAEQWSRQSELRKLKREFLPRVERALGWFYGHTSGEQVELRALFEEYRVDPALRARILKRAAESK